ncbi:MAG: choice-of-anchor E domain-containing protein [Planctomycetes bacterium]|nr:choice-of-anchor E domain-containing protein [Planctomycetota bacterium]
MGVFSCLSKKTSKPRTASRPLAIESLEERSLMSCNVISGHVFHDLNNNGLREAGENPIANATIKLVDASNKLIATTVTDSNGFYSFDHDPTVNTAETTIEQTIVYPATQTDYSLSKLVNKFDSSLGQLLAVEIYHSGTITSTIKVENTSETSPASINATVAGNIKLTGPGFTSMLDLSANAGSFNAAKYDLVLDFNGNSGFTFAPKSATGSKMLTLTGNDMAGFTGTGTVSLTTDGKATSSATGGGNLVAQLISTGDSTVKVVYRYIPGNCLEKGNYTIILNEQPPAGYVPGKLSSGGNVLNVPPGTNKIQVTLNNTDLKDNDFGELIPAKVSGYVYVDSNNNGIKENGESAINLVNLALTGTDDLGNSVSKTTQTNAAGFYEFTGLRPGSYTVTETQPIAYLDGKVTPGSTGGVAGTNIISQINLNSASNSVTNNFGELESASLSGYVYVDANNNGIKEGGESAINLVTLTLSGTDDLGNSVSKTTQTNAAGYYEFTGLRPGSYAVTETQPASYLDGIVTPGSLGGTAGTNMISGVPLASGKQSLNNNFGELVPASLSGYVYLDINNSGVKDAGDPAIANVTITLTGTTSLGSVQMTTTTNQSGFYQFTNLRPGTYTITETQPAGYAEGPNNIGTPGGQTATNQFFGIALGMGIQGTDNNFGELQPADMAIVKTVSSSTVQIGATFTYTLNVSNLGTGPAQNVSVTDTLPTGVTYVGATGAGWTITVSNGVITATRSGMAAGESSVITITAKAPLAVGTFINVSTVTSSTPDPNPTNNRSTVPITVFNQPGKVLQQNIPPLVTRAPIVSKNQLAPGWEKSMDPRVLRLLTFIDGTYKTLDNRPPTRAEATTWLTRLRKGMPASQMVKSLWNTKEHWSYEVKKIYSSILHRGPNAAELASGVNSLLAGGSLNDVRFTVLTSAEYLAAHSTPETFILGFYEDVLRQIPDSLTRLTLVQSLGTLGVADIATNLLNTSAAQSQAVIGSFIAVLRRMPSAAEIQQWTDKLQAGQVSEHSLMQTLLSSAEFMKLARNRLKV